MNAPTNDTDGKFRRDCARLRGRQFFRLDRGFWLVVLFAVTTGAIEVAVLL